MAWIRFPRGILPTRGAQIAFPAGVDAVARKALAPQAIGMFERLPPSSTTATRGLAAMQFKFDA